MQKYILLAVLLALIGAATWHFGFKSNDEAPKVLETATVAVGDVRRVLEATGIVKSQVGAIVKIGARATGEIQQMLVKVGDPVKKGDLIAVIDDRELQAQKAEAQASLARAEAELARIKLVFPLQISEAEAQLKLSQAQLTYARQNLERQDVLTKRDVVPQDTLDQAARDLDVAQSEMNARQATLNRLKQEFAKELPKAEKDLQQARAALDSVDVRISYTRILSPIDGVVSLVSAQEGETVVSGLQVSNLITVIDPSRLEMWIYVDETDVGQVTPGMPVEFRVDAFRNRLFSSSIEQIYPEPEIRDNIVYYRALCPVTREQAEALRPEMTTQCQIVVKEHAGVPVLPNTALKWIGDRQVVFVVGADGQVEQRTPKLGLQGLNNSEILDGVAVGDTVATQVVLPASTAKLDDANRAKAPGGRR